ncbi:hypothetical protein ABZ354_09245 [Streptomyces sp. NPDC005925]|uniref:hypothetical protein n=1 Tax=Streptomyces sp. NPDC005925 TaxID=3157172 RepID=UPI0033CA806B
MSTEARRASSPSAPGDREPEQPRRTDRDTPRPQNTAPRDPTPPRGETPQEPRTAAQDGRTAAARDARTNTAPGAGNADTPRPSSYRSPATGHPPPPPKASARFPDTPPPVGTDPDGNTGAQAPARPTTPPRPPASPERPAAPTDRTAVPDSATAPAEGATGRSALPPRPTGRPPAPTHRPGAPLPPARETGRSAVPPRPTGRPSEPPHRPAAATRPSGATGRPAVPPRPTGRPSVPPQPHAAPETPAETTARLRPVTPGPVPPPAGVPRPVGPPDDRTPHTAPFAAPPAARTGAARHGQGDTAPSTGRPGRSSAASRTPSPGAAAPQPDPSLSWSAPTAPTRATTGVRPVVSFGTPEGYDERNRARPLGAPRRSRTAAAALCLVLGLGLIGGAVTGSRLGGPGDGGAREAYEAAGGLWHSVPVDQLFPPTVQGRGAGPGGADRTWTRIGVAPDSGCQGAFDPLLRKVLDPVGCRRLLRATYTDATRSHVTTVGMLFTDADAAAMTTLAGRFRKDGLDRRTDLMPRPYAPKDTPAARFGAEQRASWEISVLTDAPVVVFAVSGWADGRGVDEPLPAEEAVRTGTTEAVAQAGLGHEARGLADRVERGLRKTVGRATEQPS